MKSKIGQIPGKSEELAAKSSMSNKSRSLKELFKISKFVSNEAFLEGALHTVGQEKVINEYNQGSNFAKSNQATLKILSAFMLCLLFIPTFAALEQIDSLFPIVNAENFSIFLYSVSAMTSVTLITQLIYLFTFGLTGIIGFFGARSFKILEILPFENDEIEKIAFFALFRTIDVQLLVLFFGLPITTFVMTGSIIATLAAFLVSGFHLLFAISVIMYLGHFLAKKIFNPDFNSKGKNVIKFLVSVSYVIVTVSLSLIFSLVNVMVEGLFLQSIITGDTGFIINAVLSFTVYPFGINNLYSISLFPADKIYLDQAWIPILGFFFSISVIWIVFKKSLKKLRNVTKEEEAGSGGTDKKIDEKFKTIEILTPVKAILRKDFKFVMRNFQSTMYVLMPIFFPLVIAFTLTDFDEGSNGSRFMIGLITLLYIGMGLMWTLMAATDSENNTGNLIRTLPINNSDIYKAKRTFILIFCLFANVIPTLSMLINVPSEWSITVTKFFSLILMTICGTDLILILYGRWFGKSKNGYTILEVNPERKFEKALVMMVLVYVVLYTPIIVAYLISRSLYSINFGLAFDLYWVELLVAGIILIFTRISARRIFNLKKKLKKKEV